MMHVDPSPVFERYPWVVPAGPILFLLYGKLPVVSEDAPALFTELFLVGMASVGRERCSIICLK